MSHTMSHMSHLFLTYMVIIYTKEAVSLVTPLSHSVSCYPGIVTIELASKKKKRSFIIFDMACGLIIQHSHLVPGVVSSMLSS